MSSLKIIGVVGPTASGKTSLAVKLAASLGGEIVSADSRQVYKYMDIGTGKDLPDYRVAIAATAGADKRNPHGFAVIKKAGQCRLSIPYHLIDVVHPNTAFDLAKYLRKANQAIADIARRGRLPIICGGTGLYVQALVDGYELRAAKPDRKLRAKLENESAQSLLARLKALDRGKWKSLNDSERNNKRRLIRQIEIAASTAIAGQKAGKSAPWTAEREYLVIGIARSPEETRKRILRRLNERLERQGMMDEVAALHKYRRVSWQRLESFGLEYKYIARHLRGRLEYDEMAEKLHTAICQFSRRQMSWYRRWERQGRRILWVRGYAQAEQAARRFLGRS